MKITNAVTNLAITASLGKTVGVFLATLGLASAVNSSSANAQTGIFDDLTFRACFTEVSQQIEIFYVSCLRQDQSTDAQADKQTRCLAKKNKDTNLQNMSAQCKDEAVFRECKRQRPRDEDWCRNRLPTYARDNAGVLQRTPPGRR